MARLIRRSKESHSIDRKLKMSIHNIERRCVDLEDAISEIVNRLDSLGEAGEDSSTVEELRSRMDELEDHIATEQSGIRELKGILSNIDKNLGQSFDTQAVEDKIKKVEDIVHVITKRLEKHADKPAAIDEKIADRVGDLEVDIGGLKQQIEAVRRDISKQNEVKEDPEFERVAHLEIGRLKQSVRDVEKGVEQRIEVLKKEIQQSSPKDAGADVKRQLDEVKKYRGEIEDSKMRIRSLSEAVQRITSQFGKIDTRPDKSASVKYERLQSELNDIRNSLKNLSSGLGNLGTDIENLRAEAKNHVGREEIKQAMGSLEGVGWDPKLEKRFDERFNDVGRKINDFDEKMMNLDGKMKSFDGTIKRFDGRVVGFDSIIKGVDDRMKTVDDKMRSIEGRINETGRDFNQMMSRFDEKMKDSVRKGPVQTPNTDKELAALKDEMNSMRSNTDNVRGEINNIKKVLVKMDERFSRQRGIPDNTHGKELISATQSVGNRMSELEKSFAKTRAKVNELSKQAKAEPVSLQDGYFKELTDRLIFLESRLAAIETVLRRPQPIVLE